MYCKQRHKNWVQWLWKPIV